MPNIKSIYLSGTCLIILFSQSLYSQSNTPNKEEFRISIAKTKTAIVIDGNLEEAIWDSVEIANNFFRILPIDTGYSVAQTEVKMCYDESNLYLGIICYDPWPGKRPVESLRRDFSFGLNDNFIVFMDTYNDRTNGFAFGVSAAGAQWEGQQANGGFVSLDWDGKWYSAVVNHEDRWVTEFAIPFRSIRYKVGVSEWGINFSRLDLKGNEKSSWAPMPRQFQTANLAYAGSLVWDEPPPDLGLRFSLIPYISGGFNKKLETGEETDWDGDAGVDAKITLSTSLNLDLTLNPDYSQVEVDRQVIKLDRFELFFPEKRQFFLENSDLFASLGSENIRPFFSRRIGLENPVIAGARLSGQLKQDWRIGFMNMQTESNNKFVASNFSVMAIQKQVWQNSNLGFFIVDKEVTGKTKAPDTGERSFNRILGLDFNLASSDNRWTGKAFYHRSYFSDRTDPSYAGSVQLNYQTRQLTFHWIQSIVSENYVAETGFVPRTGYHQIHPIALFKFYPASKTLANHGPFGILNLFFDLNRELTDRIVELGYRIEWLNRSNFSVSMASTNILLRSPFDPTNSGGELLPSGESYDWNNVFISYSSDSRKLLNFEFNASLGGYYNGNRFGLMGTVNYRVQPWGSLSLAAAYNKISLPDPYQDAELVLIGPRFDFTFTDQLFFTTFIQYNNQIDNLNLNARFQWRFAPVSDFYLVYTTNAYPDDLNIKDRALVAKLSYWFN